MEVQTDRQRQTDSWTHSDDIQNAKQTVYTVSRKHVLHHWHRSILERPKKPGKISNFS